MSHFEPGFERLRTLARLLVGAGMACFIALASTASADVPTFAPKGQPVKIDAHGTCRVVRNDGAAPIMIPHRSPEEWSVGSDSFLNNLLGMDRVSARDCYNYTDDSCYAWFSGFMPGKTENRVARMRYTVDGVGGWRNLTQREIYAPIGDTGKIFNNGIFNGSFNSDGGSNLVGIGSYPNSWDYINRAVAHGLRTVAIGANTRLTIYNNTWYGGGVAYQLQGPGVFVQPRVVAYSRMDGETLVTHGEEAASRGYFLNRGQSFSKGWTEKITSDSDERRTYSASASQTDPEWIGYLNEDWSGVNHYMDQFSDQNTRHMLPFPVKYGRDNRTFSFTVDCF